MSRLHQAALMGDLPLVQQYLSEGDNPNELDDGDSALHAVTVTNVICHDMFNTNTDPKNRVQIVEALVNAGANINHQDKIGRTALWHAACIHDEIMVDCLIKNRADVNLGDRYDEAPLHRASECDIGGNVDFAVVLRLLLEAGANPYAISRIGATPMSSIEFSDRPELVNLFKAYAGASKRPAPTKYDNDMKSLMETVSKLGFLKPQGAPSVLPEVQTVEQAQAHSPTTEDQASNQSLMVDRTPAQQARNVKKAYLITGGTAKSRDEKASELCRDEAFYMYATYRNGDEAVVIFSDKHSDFDGMNFNEAKALAGAASLGANFRTSTFGPVSRFGMIDISNVETRSTYRM